MGTDGCECMEGKGVWVCVEGSECMEGKGVGVCAGV
jgi:hypothetical protein